MRFAEARWAASIMMSCSMIESLIDQVSMPCVGLDHEHVGAPNAVGEAGTDLAVREVDELRVAQFDVECVGDLLGEGRVGAAR